MSKKKVGGPAFPLSTSSPVYDHNVNGMTMRDYFAGQALAGLLANPGGPIQANGTHGWGLCNCTVENVVEFSYEIADTMIAERVKQDDVE